MLILSQIYKHIHIITADRTKLNGQSFKVPVSVHFEADCSPQAQFHFNEFKLFLKVL